MSSLDHFLSQHPICRRVAWMFLFTSALILITTALLKVLTLSQSLPSIRVPDPLLGIFSVRTVLGIAVILELLVAGMIIFYRTTFSSVLWLSWLCVMFAVYRHGSAQLGNSGACLCLGDPLTWLKVERSALDQLARALLMYMSLGCALLILLRFYIYCLFRRNPLLRCHYIHD